MISSSIQMVQRKLGINILLSLIIGITMFLGIICVSTYDKITEKTAPYNDIMKMYGGVYYFGFAGFDKFLAQSEVLPNQFCGVKDSLLGVDNFCFHLLAYDDIQSKYYIPLSEGVWYTDARKTECVNVVVTPNKYFKIGDVIHPADYMPNADEALFLKVCGITADNFSYFNMTRFPERGVQDLYDNFYVDSALMDAIIFLSADDIEQFDGFHYQPFLLLGFENEANADYVYKNSFTYNKQLEMDELRKNTERIIKHKMDKVMPIFIIVLIMTLICIIAIVAIETIFELKVYAIYFMCGVSWRIVVGMNAIRSVIVYIFGLGAMSVLCLRSKEFIENQELIIAIGDKQLLAMICLFVVFILAFCVAPAIIIRRRMPVEVIRNSAE